VPAEGGRPVRTGAIRALYRQGVIKEGERTGDYWPSEWFRDRIIFRAGRGDDSIHIWDIPLNPKTFQVDGDARQITFGGAREVLPAVSDDGTLVFCGQMTRRDFWGVSLDPDSGKAGSTERRQLTTNTASNDGIGLATRDGKSVIFNSLRSGNSDIRRIDFGSHTDTPLVATPAQEYLLDISSDGSKMLYSALENKDRVLYARLSGGRVAAEGLHALLSRNHSRWLRRLLLHTRSETGPARSVALESRSGHAEPGFFAG
jgi:hypothetical protein